MEIRFLVTGRASVPTLLMWMEVEPTGNRQPPCPASSTDKTMWRERYNPAFSRVKQDCESSRPRTKWQ